MISTVFALIFLTKVINGLESTCSSEDPLKVCRFNVKRLFIPFNEEQLWRVCGRLRNYYSCVHDHASELEADQGDLCGYALVLENSEAFFRELCKTGTDLNKSYLSRGTCLSQVQLEFGKYWRHAQKFADLYYKMEVDYEFALQLVPCLAATQFLNHVNSFVMDKCRGAVDMYSQLLRASEFHLMYCQTEERYEQARLVGMKMAEYLKPARLEPEYQGNENIVVNLHKGAQTKKVVIHE